MIKSEELYKVFAQYGQIKKMKLSRDFENKSRSDYGFITYSTEDEAKSAINEFDYKDYFQVPLKVHYAKKLTAAVNHKKRNEHFTLLKKKRKNSDFSEEDFSNEDDRHESNNGKTNRQKQINHKNKILKDEKNMKNLSAKIDSNIETSNLHNKNVQFYNNNSKDFKGIYQNSNILPVANSSKFQNLLNLNAPNLSVNLPNLLEQTKTLKSLQNISKFPIKDYENNLNLLNSNSISNALVTNSVNYNKVIEDLNPNYNQNFNNNVSSEFNNGKNFNKNPNKFNQSTYFNTNEGPSANGLNKTLLNQNQDFNSNNDINSSNQNLLNNFSTTHRNQNHSNTFELNNNVKNHQFNLNNNLNNLINTQFSNFPNNPNFNNMPTNNNNNNNNYNNFSDRNNINANYPYSNYAVYNNQNFMNQFSNQDVVSNNLPSNPTSQNHITNQSNLSTVFPFNSNQSMNYPNKKNQNLNIYPNKAYHNSEITNNISIPIDYSKNVPIENQFQKNYYPGKNLILENCYNPLISNPPNNQILSNSYQQGNLANNFNTKLPNNHFNNYNNGL